MLTPRKSKSSTCWVSSIFPRRRSSSTFSSSCESALMRAAPKSPANPFNVWTARKILLTNSGSAGPFPRASSSWSRSRDRPSMISCASEKNSSRALSPMSAMGLSARRRAARDQTVHRRNQHVGAQRFGQVFVGPEGQAPHAIFFRRLRRDDEQRRRAMPIALSDELHELESVDVRHVDVGDDQVVRAARQQAQRVESARCFDDVEDSEMAAALQSRANERSRRRRVFHYQNPTHGHESV